MVGNATMPATIITPAATTMSARRQVAQFHAGLGGAGDLRMRMMAGERASRAWATRASVRWARCFGGSTGSRSMGDSAARNRSSWRAYSGLLSTSRRAWPSSAGSRQLNAKPTNRCSTDA